MQPNSSDMSQNNNSNNKKIFAIVALISFLNSVSFTIIIPTIYPYALSFGLNDQQASGLLAIYAISQFLVTPIFGRLSDIHGRKPLLVISLFGSVLSNILAAISPSAWLLFVARLVDGITGGNTSVVQAVVSDISSPQDRAKNFGIIGATFGTGFIVGPALAIFAQKYIHINGVSTLGSAFALSAIMASLATVLTVIILPETNLNKKSASNQNLFKELIAVFKFKELWTSLFIPKLGLVFWLTLLNGLAFTVFTFGYQPYFIKILGRTSEDLAWLFTLIGLIGLISNFTLGKLVKKFGTVETLIGAWIIRGLILIAMVLVPSYNWFVCWGLFFALVNPIPMPLVNTLVSNNSKPDEQGKNAGFNASYNSFSNAIGPLLSGFVISFGLILPFWLAGSLTLLVACLLFFWRKEVV